MKTLSLQDMIAVRDRDELLPVAVPQWGGQTFVRILAMPERLRLEDVLAGLQKRADLDEDTKKIRCMCVVVAAALADEHGDPLVPEGEWMLAAEAFERKAPKTIYRLFRKAGRQNALNEADMEDLEKNSDGGPAASSPTDSPSPSAAPSPSSAAT